MILYRCRQCRRLLTTARNSIDVQRGQGQAAFPFRKRDQNAAAGQLSGAGALFVEPMEWMDSLFNIAGKLYCPKCALGRFWAAAQTNLCSTSSGPVESAQQVICCCAAKLYRCAVAMPVHAGPHTCHGPDDAWQGGRRRDAACFV